MNNSDLNHRNRRIMLSAVIFVVAMIGVSFAAVPLYRAFCKATGLGGTPQRATSAPTQMPATTRKIQIRFDAMTDAALPWDFRPEQITMDVLIGQNALTNFIARNTSKQKTTGVALYNVNPPKVGKYFVKTQCFCFDNQSLAPGQTAHMPVMFYVDPKMLTDDNMKDVQEITLSYRFYPAGSASLEKAIDSEKK